MKRLLAVASLLAFSAPALAGGLSSGTKNAINRATSTETIIDGSRHISVNIQATENWDAVTESTKSFDDTTISISGFDGSGDVEVGGSLDFHGDFVDPVIQKVTSTGSTYSFATGYGDVVTNTDVVINESYIGGSTAESYDHESSSFAGSF